MHSLHITSKEMSIKQPTIFHFSLGPLDFLLKLFFNIKAYKVSTENVG